MGNTKRLKLQIEVQKQTIRMLEQQVLAMGDMCKIKDLTLQTLVGAIGVSVPKEEIEKIVQVEQGPYL